ncbi:flagellar hook-associated protein FlgL [Paramaledivibacter caminithermalis]|uniref:Flagellar hook-associated protein 3 FlgL n=1 Tax=Paramaledivibacter caminithermalis (strain DSM 15212 / CIP 107654 / DViRD3) TaxID=1121301 RepID=A0A1M6L5K2_PARC5|nr:flagellar hook-associated protein FlgL [Paramaledivibacter caminithermalis]SHJ66496.1 flagellar hook-associated protein 3 FlgL [Paramaledivibacter caminithermalis DSM 15212]
MRVTNNMIISNTLYNLNRNLARMDKRNTQLSTGKRINRPSDDPVSTAKALKLRADVSEIDQYQRNTKDALSWLDITESAIDNLQDVIHRAKELTVQASSETFSKEDRQKVKAEIEQLRDHIIQIGNTSYAGRFIFSGFQTDKELFKDDGTYNIDTTNPQTIKYQIGIGEEIEAGVFGTKLFGGTGGAPGATSEIIEDFNQLINYLDTDDTSGISGYSKILDKHLNNALSVRAEIGAETNRLELVQNRLDKEQLNFKELLSENEDVDMAETIMHLKMEESVYRASLSAGARVIQPTLLDFIR